MAVPLPILRYNFERGLSTNLGTGGATYNLSNTSCTWDITKSPFGVNGQSIYMTDNQYMTAGGWPYTAKTDTWTATCWGYLVTGGIKNGCLIAGGNTAAKALRICGTLSGGSIGLCVTGYSEISGPGYDANTWTFAAIVYKGAWDLTTPANTCDIYKNCIKATVSSFGTTDPFPLQNSLSIGREYLDWVPVWASNGTVYYDEINLYPGTLTQQDIISIYQSQVSKYSLTTSLNL